jgi:hypothetical protein
VMGRNGLPVFVVNCGAAISAVKPGTLRAKIGPNLRALAVLLESVVAFADPKSLEVR